MNLFSIVFGILLFFVYLWVTQQREGFAVGKTPAETINSLNALNDAKHGSLNMSVYKKNYQAIITELDRNADLTMLEHISAPEGKFSRGKFNDMFEFKRNLSEFKTIVNNMS